MIILDFNMVNRHWRSKIDNWGIDNIYVFTDLENNPFQKKLIMQNTNI